MASKHPNGIYYYREADGGVVASSIDVGHIYPNEISPDDPDVANDWNAYLAREYIGKRQAEYPTIQELVVALYDTDDKSAIEAKRAAVKAKYPKP